MTEKCWHPLTYALVKKRSKTKQGSNAVIFRDLSCNFWCFLQLATKLFKDTAQ